MLRVNGIRNARLVRELALFGAISTNSGTGLASMADVRSEFPAAIAAMNPSELRTIDDRYEATTTWSQPGLDRFDVVLQSRTAPAAPTVPATHIDAAVDFTSCANEPARRVSTLLALDLRNALRETVPGYMIATAFVELASLPRTPNGKIDRNALPKPDSGRTEESVDAVAPENDLEAAIALMWREMLGPDSVRSGDEPLRLRRQLADDGACQHSPRGGSSPTGLRRGHVPVLDDSCARRSSRRWRGRAGSVVATERRAHHWTTRCDAATRPDPATSPNRVTACFPT